MRKQVVKTVFLLICSLALIVALSGCGKSSNQDNQDTQKKEDMSNMDHSKMNMGDSKEKK